MHVLHERIFYLFGVSYDVCIFVFRVFLGQVVQRAIWENLEKRYFCFVFATEAFSCIAEMLNRRVKIVSKPRCNF